MPNLTFKEAKDRFIKFGECNHERKFHKSFTPYKCPTVILTECSICSERISKEYVTC